MALMASASSFVALRDLHDTANDLLHSPIMKRQVLIHRQHAKLLHEVSEASLKMLDMCDTTKDVLLLVKNHLLDLQSTFRRITLAEVEPSNQTHRLIFSSHHLHRKRLKKEILKRLRLLKEMKSKCINGLQPLDQNLTVVVSLLREVRIATMSIMESLMSLMAMPCPNRKTGSLVAKLMRVNSLSLWENCDAKELQYANERLEAVEMAIEDLEVELEFIFRRLIQTRVSLLNILTN